MWDQIKVASHSDSQVVEYLNFLQEDVFVSPVQVKQGHYVAPSSDGWGLEMHDSFIDDHLYPSGKVWNGREKSGSITFLA
jgi:L-fuconate dehydratase